jgi:hypothetical protein
MLRLLLLGATMLATTCHLHAQKYSNEFLSIGVGARAQGMAGAQLAHVGDATAGFWNPAGLTQIDTDLQVAAMHNEWFAGIGQYDYIGFAAPIANKSRYIGFTFIRFGVDNIPNTLSLYEKDGTVNYNNVSTFNAADYAFMLHYAQKIESIGLSFGITPKVVHRKVGPFATSWGFGIDIGAQLERGDWRFGLMLKDISTTFNAWSFNFTEEEKETLELTNNEIPIKSMEITYPTIGLGVAYIKDFKIGKPKEGKKQKYIGLIAELDFNMTTDGRRNTLISADPISLDPSLGLELHYNNLVFLRGGINNIQQFKDINNNKKWAIQPNFGVGFRIYKFHIDYALGLNAGGAVIDNTQGAVLSHIVSVKIDISFKFIKEALKDQD